MRVMWVSLCVAASMLLLGVLAGCGGGGGGTATPPTLATGTVDGHVYFSPEAQALATTRSGDMVGAAGAEVRVQYYPLSTTTGDDGSFTLTGLPAGLHQLVISHSGHQMLELPVTVQAGTTVHIENAGMSPTPRKWTVLVYMNADNDLEQFGIEDINEMEKAPDNEQVAVIVQADRSPGYDTSNGNWTETRRLLIQHDTDPQTITSPALETMGEVDMGSPQTAQAFLAWGQQMYPAEHYLFIFWNHGNGWRSRTATSVVTRGISYDDTSSTYIRIVDLPAALAAPAPVDLVSFDACLMQMLEIGYEMRDVCHYVVAAEDDVPGEGYDYQTWLTPLRQTASLSPRELADTMQRTAWESYRSLYSYVTYSVVDTSALAGVVTAVDRLAGALSSVASSYPTECAAARNEADAYTDRDYKDLYDYAALIKAKVPKTTVRDAADAVMASVNQAVVAEYHASGHPNAHGLSIYVPSPSSYVRSGASYRALALSLQTQWDEWLGRQPQ